MTSLEVIGAGMGRTGTRSLFEALNILGYKTHHGGFEILGNPDQDPAVWLHAYDHPFSPETQWDKVYGAAGYTAAVDFPTCVVYKELMVKYPDAKVILTLRKPEDWFKSASKTTIKLFQTPAVQNPDTYHGRVRDALLLTRHAILGGVIEKNPPEKLEDATLMIDLFNKHNEDVIKSVPPERLLIMNLGDGWDNLCQFLGKPIPDVPYPTSNNSGQFNEFLEEWEVNHLRPARNEQI
ncbi:P-loop containing nucleoside triphosphate hydrolase protein [Gongronella butleri]|nr:P-loop containing nucleoside triphosphate hydrolase protein [Gongronella butleri]